MKVKCVLLSLLFTAPTLVQAVLPIHTKNYRFIRPSSPDNDAYDNEVFFVKGVDYQPGGSSGYDSSSGSDALSDASVCARDVFALQQLGVNTIRVYSLNPDVNHDECMTILNDAGIYVILDVNSGNYGESLNRADPSETYNAQYLKRVFKFIDAFKEYPNVLGFFSGNEVINDDNDYAELDPQYIRAVQRDMKQYIAKHSNRSIPVGYSAANQVELRLATFKYLQCNALNSSKIDKDLEESRSDFFGLNTYEWCSGSSTWETSGYGVLKSNFSDATIPLIFSEYGCNAHLPRTFDEVSDGLYGGLIDLFSGGLVYEYFEEENNYGLVEVDDSDGSLEYKDDFVNLKSQYSKVDFPDNKESDVNGTSVYKCDAAAITSIYPSFGVKQFSIPSQPAEISSMIAYGVNGTNTGSILEDYTAPTTFDYTIKNTDGKAISATIIYDSSNFINSLSVTSHSSSATSPAKHTTSAPSSSSFSSSSSSSASKTSSSSKSKGAAVEVTPASFPSVISLLAAAIYAIL